MLKGLFLVKMLFYKPGLCPNVNDIKIQKYYNNITKLRSKIKITVLLRKHVQLKTKASVFQCDVRHREISD